MQVVELIRLIRPQHWIKNVIVLLPLVFAFGDQTAHRGLDDFSAIVARTLWAVLAFCLASSAVYVFNDLCDAEADRKYPSKARRPLAAGTVSPLAAWPAAVLLALAALLTAVQVNRAVAVTVAAYLVLQVAYSLLLKRLMILDVLAISAGFFLRALAGVLVLPSGEISPWLFVCLFTLCAFMGFCKRRNEAATLTDTDAARKHRLTLVGYTPELLTHAITISGTLAIVAFLQYATNAATVERFGTTALVYTLPAVFYGVVRFAMLSITGHYDGPTALILRDRPLQLTVTLWGLAVVAVLYRATWMESLTR